MDDMVFYMIYMINVNLVIYKYEYLKRGIIWVEEKREGSISKSKRD